MSNSIEIAEERTPDTSIFPPASPTVEMPTTIPTFTPFLTNTPTLTPTNTATPIPTQTPQPATATHTPNPLTPVAPESPYYPDLVDDPTLILNKEHIFEPYFVRHWCTPPQSTWPHCVVTIEVVGKPTIEIGPVHRVNDLTGQDITGNGNPNVIVSVGPLHGTIVPATIVYDLGDEPVEIFHSQYNRCHTQFEDLNGDGVMEAISCDSTFAYNYCPGATDTGNVRVIYHFEQGHGYVPANLQFADQYAEDIIMYTEIAEKATPGGYSEFDGTTKCSVLDLVLAYLYSGQPEEAWGALHRYYNYPDLEAFIIEIKEGTHSSPLFVNDEENE